MYIYEYIIINTLISEINCCLPYLWIINTENPLNLLRRENHWPIPLITLHIYELKIYLHRINYFLSPISLSSCINGKQTRLETPHKNFQYNIITVLADKTLHRKRGSNRADTNPYPHDTQHPTNNPLEDDYFSKPFIRGSLIRNELTNKLRASCLISFQTVSNVKQPTLNLETIRQYLIHNS